MKLIDEHKQWCRTGVLPSCNGLCSELKNTEYEESLDLFRPSAKERIKLNDKGISVAYWGSGLKWHAKDIYKNYTELRQNIVLLICAMHDEL